VLNASLADSSVLVQYLNTLNNRQGLGFVSNGTVLDKKVLLAARFGSESSSDTTV